MTPFITENHTCARTGRDLVLVYSKGGTTTIIKQTDGGCLIDKGNGAFMSFKNEFAAMAFVKRRIAWHAANPANDYSEAELDCVNDMIIAFCNENRGKIDIQAACDAQNAIVARFMGKSEGLDFTQCQPITIKRAVPAPVAAMPGMRLNANCGR